MSRAGFKQVYSMEGGINAWNGAVAEGLPEAGLSFFASARSPEDYIALAWLLEEGMKMFYRSVGERLDQREAIELFQELSIAEEHHQTALSDLHFRFSGKRIDPDFLRSAVPDLQTERYMEGGLRLEEAILWAERKKMADILEMSITLEANAYDRYLFMKQEIKDARVKEVFNVLSNEEKRHLNRLSELFDRQI